jgi:hypothetical protein
MPVRNRFLVTRGDSEAHLVALRLASGAFGG